MPYRIAVNVQELVAELKENSRAYFWVNNRRWGEFIASYVGKEAVNVVLIPNEELKKRRIRLGFKFPKGLLKLLERE